MTAAEHPSERRLTALSAFVLVLGIISVAVAVAVSNRFDPLQFDYLVAGGFAAAFFVMRLVTLRLPQGDEVSVVIVVGLAGLGLLHIAELVAAALAVGLLDAVARFAQSSRPANAMRAVDAVRSAAVLALLSPWQIVLSPVAGEPSLSDAVLIPVLGAGLTYAMLDIITLAVQQRVAGGPSIAQGVHSLIRPLGSIYLVHIAMAAVAFRVGPVLGYWALAIAVLMTLILQNSLSLYLRIRRGYTETIGALARAAELDRPQDAGHARRVADLAIAVGRELGLSSHELERLGYAALLHDIGRIGHGDETDSAVHARRGAEIVEPIPFLADVAPLIEHHHDRVGDGVPIGAAIVGVCSRYDRLRGRHGAHMALETIIDEESGVRLEVGRTLAGVVRNPRYRRAWGS